MLQNRCTCYVAVVMVDTQPMTLRRYISYCNRLPGTSYRSVGSDAGCCCCVFNGMYPALLYVQLTMRVTAVTDTHSGVRLS